jgi:lipoate-protein ligase A
MYKDYDYKFLLDVMYCKLRRMQSFFESGNTRRSFDARKKSLEIKDVADRLERYLKNEYKDLDHAKTKQEDFEYIFDTLKEKLQTWRD